MKIGVLTPVKHSKYIKSVFIIPNKGGTVKFITDYHRINQRLLEKSDPLPRIGNNIQQLEGF